MQKFVPNWRKDPFITMNMIANKRSKLLGLVAKTLDGIQKEIDKSSQRLEALDELQHLLFIQSVLIEMKSHLDQNNFEKILKLKPSIARIVIDTWPSDNLIGNQICQIEYNYERLSK